MIFRYGLYQGLISFIKGVSKAKTQRAPDGLVIFLAILFSKINWKTQL